MFFSRYGVSVNELTEKIKNGYKSLFEEMSQKNLKYLDNVGDYIFVSGEGDLDSAVKIRDLEKFVVE